MKKIKLNSLPEGFEIRNGKIVETKKHGGVTTGDQSNYSLVTTGTNLSSENTDETSVKYSLSPVPRDEANIEAEGGETVLTDLNGDGKFGLYDIKGKRHSNGGVPLFLPEQSFVYTDFNKMKLYRDQMAEFGIETKKRLTPAKVSKKFGLNEYYGKINDPYADDIQISSSELMLNKNKGELSKLAFMQELNKDFKDGVPVSSYPYLMSIGEDPIEFTAKVEEISKQKAQQQAIESLPYEQQMQIAQLQEYMAQVNQQPQQQGMQQQGMQQQMPQEMQQMQQGMPPQGQGMMPPSPDMNAQQMAQMGYELYDQDLPMAQGGTETKLTWRDIPGDYSEEEKRFLFRESRGTYIYNDKDQYKSDKEFFENNSWAKVYFEDSNEGEKRRAFQLKIMKQREVDKKRAMPSPIDKKKAMSSFTDLQNVLYNIVKKELQKNYIDFGFGNSLENQIKNEVDYINNAIKQVFNEYSKEGVQAFSEYAKRGDFANELRDILTNGSLLTSDDINNIIKTPQFKSLYGNISTTKQDYVEESEAKIKVETEAKLKAEAEAREETIIEGDKVSKFNWDKYDWDDDIPETRQKDNKMLNWPIIKAPPKTSKTPKTSTSSGPGPKDNIAYDPALVQYYLDNYNIDIQAEGIEERLFKDTQPSGTFGYGGAEKNWEGWKNRFKNAYPKFDEVVKAVEKVNGQGKIKEWEEWQRWFDKEFIPNRVKQIGEEKIKSGISWTDKDAEKLKKQLIKDVGFDGGVGEKYDGKVGTYSTSRINLKGRSKAEETEPVPPVEEVEGIEEGTKEDATVNVPGVAAPRRRSESEFWLQDLIKLNAIKQRKRDMFFPWQPAVRRPEVDYTLEDPTRSIAAMNEQLNIANQAIGAFSGPQSLAARTAEAQGKTAENVANVIANVNNRNVNTVNRGLALQTRYDQIANTQEDIKNVAVYDNTQKVLQNYMNELNFDREQYADQLANSYTNRANTYNLNSIQDYYQIDPLTGGMIGQFSSKAWDTSPPGDPDALEQRIIDFAQRYRTATNGESVPASVIDRMIKEWKGTTGGYPKTNIGNEYPQYYPAGVYGADFIPPQYKEGGEVKTPVIPFFTGITGM